MAFSQVQCLDDSHVNWRSSESKPEFFYSEEQRLALEALVSKGPDAFYEVLKKENIRDFLSELELKKILDTLETYDPGSEFIPRGDDGGADLGSQDGEQDQAHSLEYWPQRSDRSIPQLDLGWPETIAYRGVTRATVYMQPPIDCQPHIKEVVRKMISQAQKVVAVVMDMFTDVDIFKDLLDAGFKRKVGIYIILDETNLKYFLQMCERAQMHAGHLKNLRVRTTGGTEFFTRSATKFKGALAQKFMFVDGDKAMSGSYSFTWSAARTDRNIISVLTGQVVEAFDKQFQELYLMSRGVSLKSIPMEEEPEPEPLVLPTLAPVNPAVVKKMFNPKYALVKAKSAEQITNSKASSDKNVAEQQKAEAKRKAIPEARVSERPSDVVETGPPIHPGLLNLEKANMFEYLPTWVEPDPEPGSEILGYINIIDPKIKNIQLSQMNRIKVCDVSKANAQHKKMLRQKSQEAKRGHDNQPAMAPCQQLDAAAPPAQTQEACPNPTASPTEKTPGNLRNGETFATLANSQHLKQPLDAQTQGQMDSKGTAAPIPKPRTVHVTDLISAKTVHAEDGAASAEGTQAQHPGTGATNASQNESPKQAPDAKSSCKLGRQTSVYEEVVPFPVNGVQGGEEEEEEEDYVTLSDHESLSGSSATNHSHLHSDASSVSDEYCKGRRPCGPLRRTNSDFLPNGGGHSPQHHPDFQRKLSEPYVSRGSFPSPLGSPQPMLSLGVASQMRRRSDSVEEIRDHNCSATGPGCKCLLEEAKVVPRSRKPQEMANTSRMEAGPKSNPQAQPASRTGRAKVSALRRTHKPAASPKEEAARHEQPPPQRPRGRRKK
ncbi:protein FAM83G isoform X2 [Lacerta agilis]|uniref:protein FAM83G isoform X2 n=1 Tax=Lacerta agilis TaxID=80427 RepID=UPI001419D577|nr:protein FAM83G isoform X2 [Lacerta agilis]